MIKCSPPFVVIRGCCVVGQSSGSWQVMVGVNEVMLKLRAPVRTRQAVLPSLAKLCVCACVEGGVFVGVTERTCCFQSSRLCGNDGVRPC